MCVITNQGYVVPLNIRNGLPYIDMTKPMMTILTVILMIFSSLNPCGILPFLITNSLPMILMILTFPSYAMKIMTLVLMVLVILLVTMPILTPLLKLLLSLLRQSLP
jgi:hypothetical protein